jgi:hypothetical protein
VPGRKSDDDQNLCKSAFDCNLEEMLANMRTNNFRTTFSKATQYLGVVLYGDQVETPIEITRCPRVSISWTSIDGLPHRGLVTSLVQFPDILYHTFVVQGDNKGAQMRLWDISTGAVSAQLKAADSLCLTTHLSDVPVS